MPSTGCVPSRPNILFVTMDGRDTISTIKNTSARHIQISILNKVCRKDHAADMTAPTGPPAAVPAATSATAFPPSTPALTVAAAAFAVASAPFAAACFAVSCPACFAALAI